jgi:membrane protease subunit HflC
MTRYVLIPVALLLLLWGRTAFYSVDQAEFAVVTRFGEPIAVHDGATAAGLHTKLPWPIDAVQRIDRRVQAFDLPAVEVLTRDRAREVVQQSVGTTLTVDATVTWKIPDAKAADRFLRAVRTRSPEEARKKIGPMINSRLASVIGSVPIEYLIDVVDVQTAAAALTGNAAATPSDAHFRAADYQVLDERVERVRRLILGEEESLGPPDPEGLRARAREEFGIEIVDIRVRRFSYPEAVRAKIAERIRSERDKKAADYESEGRKRAADIATDADRAARTIEADARARKTVIEGQANAEAARVRAAAYAQDREFYLFLESLRSFQGILGGTRDVLLLSTKHPLLKPLAGPPAPPK